jgi:hypothetical protein
MADKKPCPQCVIDAGAAFVVLRHYLKGAEKLYGRVFQALEDTYDTMQKEGMMQAEYGPALEKLHEARASYGKIMAAHLHMAGALGRINMETPTDAQILKTVGMGNWR